MCGISGCMTALRDGLDIDIIRKMNSVIAHRGPDDEGYALVGTDRFQDCYGVDTVDDIRNNGLYRNIKDMKKNHYFLALGHRRLSILDPTSLGHQPMFDAETKNYVVFNGEIYNYIEIRSELENQGMAFKTNCDTEVLLKAYAMWGTECVKKFNGMWAFAIWDSSQKSLFLSRDRLGVKPLYYYLDSTKLRFGSEIKQIIQDDGIERILNEEVLASCLIYGITDYCEQTLIKNINLLPSATNMLITIDDNSCLQVIRKWNYWNLEINPEISSEDNAVKIVGDLINKSIQYRLRSDVDIGVLLSGGLDSSSLVTLISRIRDVEKHDNLLNTYTSCYDHTPHDERYFAELVNHFNGCKAHYINPAPVDIDMEIKRMVWHMEGITRAEILGFMQTLEGTSKTGVKVVMNGQNADETLFGYERYYAYYFRSLIKDGKVLRAWKEFRAASKNSKLSMKQLVLYYLYFNVPLVRDVKNKVKAKICLQPSFINKLNYNKLKNIIYSSNLIELMHHELTATQLPHILRMDDKGYMAFSMESRVPFCDYEYVEKVVNILPEIKIKNGYTKYLLRAYMNHKMPREVTWRKDKLGFSSPTENWTNKIDENYINHLISTSRTKNIFRLEKVKALYKTEGAKNSSVFDFIQLEMFMRLFDVKAENEVP